MTYDWESKFRDALAQTSKPGTRAALNKVFPAASEFWRGTVGEDKRGGDIRVVFEEAGVRFVDIKFFKQPWRKYWADTNIPEVCLETWSVVPGTGGGRGKIGWTLDRSKITDFVLYIFDPGDDTEPILLPFMELQTAFMRNMDAWTHRHRNKLVRQNSKNANQSWQSEMLWMPIDVVEQAVFEAIQNGLATDEEWAKMPIPSTELGDRPAPRGERGSDLFSAMRDAIK